ncbi:kelch 20 [Paramuricea clavata]|uniref:Kelch 20 n=1 Tax=Paramuricea clavata TaxID=317549 RepID=A0A7D9JHT3_PARCT|nr:kelch 20 [Paramuricea clavata]
MACCPTEENYGYEDSRFEKAVDAHFHCSICYNVLKEPMMCRNNEHIFWNERENRKPCIQRRCRRREGKFQISSAINHASNMLMEDILVGGGWDSGENALKSVERFSWKKNVWKRVSSMNVGRVGATSFVYENQLFVAGGCDSRVIEVLNLDEDPMQWGESMAKVPYHCQYLRSVVYQNRAGFFCGCNNNDYCAELCLTAPYTCKQLCKMSDPTRINYTVVAFEHKVLVFGGSTADNNSLDSVLEFDVSTKEFKAMPSLPCALEKAAAVRWGDEAILIGGADKDGQTNRVFMYNSKTGNITELPPMKEERCGCAAIITGNTIVVMGGRGKTTGRVRSVEAFTLGGYSWRYLPAMNEIRSLPIATVLPTKNVR